MKKVKKKSVNSKEEIRKPHMLRERTITFSLNDLEYKALQKYCTKYKVINRARFIRESVMKNILTRMSEDYPTLFEENEMR